MNRFFFIDYDNTIFSHRTGSTPESALNALVRLKQSGHKVFISSGRSFRGDLSDIFVHRFTPDGLVSANGAIVEAEGKVLRDACFPPEIQRRLFDFVLEKDYCLRLRTSPGQTITLQEKKRYPKSNFEGAPQHFGYLFFMHLFLFFYT